MRSCLQVAHAIRSEIEETRTVETRAARQRENILIVVCDHTSRVLNERASCLE